RRTPHRPGSSARHRADRGGSRDAPLHRPRRQDRRRPGVPDQGRGRRSRGVGEQGLMASTNLELVRSVHAAWNRGDYSSVEWAHPEIEFVIADGPSPGSWTGLAGMAEGTREWLSPWEEFRQE